MSMSLKQNSPSQQKLIQLQELESRISQAETQLTNRKTELSAAVRRSQHLHAETEAETKRLLTERSKQLAILIADNENRLKPLAEKLAALEKRRDELARLNNSAESDLEALRHESEAVKHHITDEKSAIQARKTEVHELESLKSSLQQDIAAIREDKHTLETALSELRQENASLEQENSRLLAQNAQEQYNFETLTAGHLDKLRILEDKQVLLANKLQEAHKQEKAVREDLAVRIRACDERERNLKMRELKVSQSETSIQRNAALLEL
jgi:chromosome segregation ATPase